MTNTESIHSLRKASIQALINWWRCAFDDGPEANVEGVSIITPDDLPVYLELAPPLDLSTKHTLTVLLEPIHHILSQIPNKAVHE